MSAPTSSPPRPVLDYAAQQRKPTRNLIGIGLMILLHAALLYAISSGLGRKFVKIVKAPVEAKLIEEVKLPDLPPPPPPPPKNLPPPPPPAYVPPVDVPQASAPAAVGAITAVTSTPPPPAPVVVAPPPAPQVRVPAILNAASNCPKPEYPAASRRMEEEGTVLLRFLVEVDGKIVQAAIEKSSGFPRLDEAAKLALSKCQFKPGTVDGKAEQSWANLKYTWKLE